jgi:TRAP-type C4-dicarboxylate transport system permease large subunit
MFHEAGVAVVAATLFVGISGSAVPTVAADPAGMVLARATDAAQERTRQDCIRNGGCRAVFASRHA